ncbi:MAG: nuclear transport factor 2 family protein [Burkholderiales bacterium]|nr:nuclear transport factor 2 family protein [Burkholderiales bacterium]
MRHACPPLAALPLTALVAACTSVGLPASKAQPRAAIERVFENFNHCNIDDLVLNYADDNLVFVTPGTPEPVSNRAGLRKYFSYLAEDPCASPQSAKHTDIQLQVRSLAATAAVVHAHTVVRYVHENVAHSRPFFFTFVLQEVGGQWLVVSQNAQPVPER